MKSALSLVAVAIASPLALTLATAPILSPGAAAQPPAPPSHFAPALAPPATAAPIVPSAGDYTSAQIQTLLQTVQQLTPELVDARAQLFAT